MKKTILFCAVLSILAISCNAQNSSEKKLVKTVAFEYENALANYDMDRAEKFATNETSCRTLVTARAMVRMVSDSIIQLNLPAKVRITNVKITSDTTATAVWHKKTPRKRNSGEIELRKRNGVWQAHDMLKQMPARRQN